MRISLALFLVLFLTSSALYADMYCSYPRRYKVVEIDKRFGLTKGELEAILADAASVWNREFGRQLLVKDSNKPDIEIRMRYGKAQELYAQAMRLKDSGMELVGDITSFNQMQDNFNVEAKDIASEVENYNERMEQLQVDIDDWKKNPSQLRRNQLQLEQERLLERYQKIAQRKKDFKKNTSFMKEWRSLLESMQGAHKNEWLLLEQLQARQMDFRHAGLYQRMGKEETIYIYLYSSKAELKSVMAHEFGHALGIAHVNDVKALMYPELSDTNRSLSRLTTSDVGALRARCKNVSKVARF